MSDLVVVGAGMAGLSAAAHAARLGAQVTVLEKGNRIGGSARLSAGILWTAPDIATLRAVCPDGDPALGGALVEGFDGAVEHVRSFGVEVSERWQGQMGFGVAHRVGIQALLERQRAVVEEAGGSVLCRAPARALVRGSDGRVAGVRGAAGEHAAPAVLLATGGFQGDPELVAAMIGSGADELPLRANSGSTGDGFRLGRAAGVAASRGLGGFYGHLLPAPLNCFEPDDFLPFTQYHSQRSILVNLHGRRFCDESRGDETSNQAALRQPGRRALLLLDERVRREVAEAAPYPHGQAVDRLAVARAAGARYAAAPTQAELVRTLAAWGVPAGTLAATLSAYDRASRGETPELDAPLPARPEPLTEPPFHALLVQPSLTFAFGGLRVDADGRALDRDGGAVPGLFAAGADAGGLQVGGYVGGLVLGLVFGPRAAAAALAGL